MSCNDFDCLALYSCGTPSGIGTNPRTGRDKPGAIFAPFVQVGFSGPGSAEITVGNQSSPPDNHAVIKSFEYGFSEGAGVKLEIYDEEGSSLADFVNRLSKTVCNAGSDYKMNIDFGWIIEDCDGNITTEKASDYGNNLYFLPLKIEMAFESGKIKYTIEGTDLQDRISETSSSIAEGRDDAGIDLKTAIRNLFARSCPPFDPNNILFQDINGNEWDFANSVGGPNGPVAVWNPEQQNNLAAVRRWISNVTTENNKGIVMQWKPDAPQPTIVFLEDPNPAPDENTQCCQYNMGTYIVNGGNCSPVIQFSPQVNWTLSTGAGRGATTPGGSSAGSATPDDSEGDEGTIERSGIPYSGTIDQNMAMWLPHDQHARQTQRSDEAHTRATSFREIPQSINAELRIVGDPALAFPLGGAGLVGKSVSIVVINPFYVTSSGAGCDWLANPPCNEILSNKHWMIMGANHQIREGSYTTTLKLFLAVPGQQSNPNMTLGGNCGTISFPNANSQDQGEEQ